MCVCVCVCVCVYVGQLWENIKKEVSEILSKLGFHNKTKGLCFATVFFAMVVNLPIVFRLIMLLAIAETSCMQAAF